MIPEAGKQEKIDTRMARKVTHKYNTRFRVNHVTTFKNTTKILKMDTTDTPKKHIGSVYIYHTYPKIYTITMKPIANQIKCETTGKS